MAASELKPDFALPRGQQHMGASERRSYSKTANKGVGAVLIQKRDGNVILAPKTTAAKLRAQKLRIRRTQLKADNSQTLELIDAFRKIADALEAGVTLDAEAVIGTLTSHPGIGPRAILPRTATVPSLEESIEASDALSRAMERGNLWKQGQFELAISDPNMLRPSDAEARSHLSRSRLDVLQREGRVLALRRGNMRLYPAWQFLAEGYNQQFGEILRLFSGRDPFWTFRKLTTPQSLLAGKLPKDLIRRRSFDRLHVWALQLLDDEQGAL